MLFSASCLAITLLAASFLSVEDKLAIISASVTGTGFVLTVVAAGLIMKVLSGFDFDSADEDIVTSTSKDCTSYGIHSRT